MVPGINIHSQYQVLDFTYIVSKWKGQKEQKFFSTVLYILQCYI